MLFEQKYRSIISKMYLKYKSLNTQRIKLAPVSVLVSNITLLDYYCWCIHV